MPKLAERSTTDMNKCNFCGEIIGDGNYCPICNTTIEQSVVEGRSGRKTVLFFSSDEENEEAFPSGILEQLF